MADVNAQEESIPEATSEEQIAEHTLALLQHDIPGFIIRSEVQVPPSSDYAETIHRANVYRVQSIVEELHPDKKTMIKDIAGFRGLGQDPIGTFHVDVHSDAHETNAPEILDRTEPLVHTTLTGGGKVTIAHIGTNPDRVFKEADLTSPRGERTTTNSNSPHNLLLNGRVNPEMVNPRIYRGKVGPGDSVVIAAGNSRHAAWHRMDTDKTKGVREVRASKIVDNTKGYSSRTQKNDYEGFGLPK